jgi:aarF domain-containing kinase
VSRSCFLFRLIQADPPPPSLKTVNFAVAWVDRLFPAFEFAWLAREVNENLPIEMDFRIEAKNAARTEKEFSKFRRTSLYIPEVRWAKKRILVMECMSLSRGSVYI